jgi:hypothetical protein
MKIPIVLNPLGFGRGIRGVSTAYRRFSNPEYHPEKAQPSNAIRRNSGSSLARVT